MDRSLEYVCLAEVHYTYCHLYLYVADLPRTDFGHPNRVQSHVWVWLWSVGSEDYCNSIFQDIQPLERTMMTLPT